MVERGLGLAWWNGIHDGLKIRWVQARAGSNPAASTIGGIHGDAAFDKCYGEQREYVMELLEQGYKVDEIVDALGGDRIARSVVEHVKEERR